MKIRKLGYFAVLTISIAITACKSKSVVTDPKTQSTMNQPELVKVKEPNSLKIEEVQNVNNENQNQSNDELYSLVVSFFSIGAGIDAPVATEFDFYVRDFQEQHGDYFLAERVAWGREGEVDYCIQFPNLNREKAREFVNKAREITSPSKMVHIKENAPCKRRRKSN